MPDIGDELMDRYQTLAAMLSKILIYSEDEVPDILSAIKSYTLAFSARNIYQVANELDAAASYSAARVVRDCGDRMRKESHGA